MTCNTVTGSNLSVKVKSETTYGLSETSGFKTVFVKSNSIKFSQNTVESQLLAAGRSPTKAGQGNIEVTGAIEFAMDNVQSGFWLKHIFGNYAYTPAFVGAKNKHTFKISDTCLPSFQVEKTLLGSDINYKSVGLKANNFKMDLGGEGEIIGSVDVIGKNEFFSTLQVDSTNAALTANANINTKTLLVASATGLEVGEVITLKIAKSTIASNAAAGLSVIEVAVGEGVNFASGDFISIGTGGLAYQIKAVSVDKIYLSRALEVAITATTVVYNVSETNKIEAINGLTLTLVNGIKQNMLFATDSIQSASSTTVMNDKTFEHFEITLTSTTGSVITAALETMSFSFANNAEGKRLISDKGTIGKIFEGKAAITCDLNVVFDAENARFIEDAKLGKEFDITISAINSNGDYLNIILPQGTLTPMTPEISSPTAINVSLTYTPFKIGASEAIVVELINNSIAY